MLGRLASCGMLRFHWGFDVFSERDDTRSDEKNEVLLAKR